MNVRTESIESITIDTSTKPIAGGGEGEIYPLPPNMLLKIYHDTLITEARQEKVLELCSRYHTYRGLFNQQQYAFPQEPAKRIDLGKHNHGEIIGFSMVDLGIQHQKLDFIGFQKNGFRVMPDGRSLTDDSAIILIYELYECLHKLHTSRIVLGDLNPSNILFNFDINKPCFIDIDSSLIPDKDEKNTNWSEKNDKELCAAFSGQYLDPLVVESGVTSKGYFKYSRMSDCFAMAVIAYELFVGANPFEFQTNPPMDLEERRQKRIALIGHVEDSGFLQRMGCTLTANNQNAIRIDRLRLLKSKDALLYNYLFESLIRDHRINLLKKLPKSDKRNPAHAFFAKGRVKTIIQALEEGAVQLPDPEGVNEDIMGILRRNTFRRVVDTSDPDMFMRFVSNMGIDYQRLLLRGVQPNA